MPKTTKNDRAITARVGSRRERAKHRPRAGTPPIVVVTLCQALGIRADTTLYGVVETNLATLRTLAKLANSESRRGRSGDERESLRSVYIKPLRKPDPGDG